MFLWEHKQVSVPKLDFYEVVELTMRYEEWIIKSELQLHLGRVKLLDTPGEVFHVKIVCRAWDHLYSYTVRYLQKSTNLLDF